MSTPIPTPIALQSAAAKRASLQALMTTPLALERYDPAAGAYAPLGTVYADLATPTAGAKPYEDKMKLQVAVGTDLQIGDRFPYEGWHWKIVDAFSVLLSSIPVALQATSQRDTPLVADVAAASTSAIDSFATLDTRRDGRPYLTNVGAEVTKPSGRTVLPTGEAVDYLVNVPLTTDIEQNDVLALTSFGGYTLPVPDQLLVLARTWAALPSGLVRQLLVQDTQIGG